MSAQGLEAFLARLYVDETARARFLQDPEAEGRRAGLSSEELRAVVAMDQVGLLLMAESLRHKRERQVD